MTQYVTPFDDDKIVLNKCFHININHDKVTIDGGNNMIYIDDKNLRNGIISNNEGNLSDETTLINECTVKNFDVYFNIGVETGESNSSKNKGFRVRMSIFL